MPSGTIPQDDATADLPANIRDWVFPSPTSATGHVQDPHHLYARISEAGGAKFWFHGLRNCFITVAERELMLPPSLTKRLVNHARPNDVTEGYAADWTLAQLREPAQKIADRIDALSCLPPRDAVRPLPKIPSPTRLSEAVREGGQRCPCEAPPLTSMC